MGVGGVGGGDVSDEGVGWVGVRSRLLGTGCTERQKVGSKRYPTLLIGCHPDSPLHPPTTYLCQTPRGLSIRLHLSSPPCPHPHQYSIHTPSRGASPPSSSSAPAALFLRTRFPVLVAPFIKKDKLSFPPSRKKKKKTPEG